MIVSNTQYYKGLDFADYLIIPGTSYSVLKGEISSSIGMRLGTSVHSYLLEPSSYVGDQREVVSKISAALRTYIGDAFQYLEKEVAFTADFEHNGLVLPYKGRADLIRVGRLIIDLKVLGGSLSAAVERFGYKDQISGYCLSTGASLGLIIAYNKLKKRVEVQAVKPDSSFWSYTTLTHGKPK